MHVNYATKQKLDSLDILKINLLLPFASNIVDPTTASFFIYNSEYFSLFKIITNEQWYDSFNNNNCSREIVRLVSTQSFVCRPSSLVE